MNQGGQASRQLYLTIEFVTIDRLSARAVVVREITTWWQ
jgi:hypothetical protein